jgi:hypothetical protein
LASALGCAREDSVPPVSGECPADVIVSGPLLRDPSPLLGDADDGGDCRIDGQGRLSPSCLPRCSLATRPTFYACRTQGCEDGVTALDATATTSVTSELDATVSLDCSGCIQRARAFCFARTCPMEQAAQRACYASGQPSCAAENGALSACFLNRQHVYEPCLFLAEDSCFPASL